MFTHHIRIIEGSSEIAENIYALNSENQALIDEIMEMVK